MYSVSERSVKSSDPSQYPMGDAPSSGQANRSKMCGNTDTKQHSPFEEKGSAKNAKVSSDSSSSGDQEVISLISKLIDKLSSLLNGLGGSRSGNSSETGTRSSEVNSESANQNNSGVSKKSSNSDTANSSNRANDDTKTDRSDAPTTAETNDISTSGAHNIVDEPIVVDGGVFDGKGATYTASSKLGDGGQGEGQKPIFILKNGATLKNVNIGENGADGVHVYGGATLNNVNWQDVGEDALTVKSSGDVNIIGGSASNASDKIFQINADTTFYLKDFEASGFQTLVRTNGGKPITANVTIDGGQFANGTTLFRTDSQTSNVEFTGQMDVQNVELKKRFRDEKTAV